MWTLRSWAGTVPVSQRPKAKCVSMSIPLSKAYCPDLANIGKGDIQRLLKLFISYIPSDEEVRVVFLAGSDELNSETIGTQIYLK